MMFWPAIVMRVRLGSALSGRKVQTTFEKAISFLRSKGDVLVPDGVEGVCAFHTLLGGVSWIDATDLAQPSKFIGVGGVSVRAQTWVAAECAVFKGLTSLRV